MRWRRTEFEGYLISSCGKVWSCKSNKFLKGYKHPEGYLLVSLSVNGKNIKRFIHRLVAISFLESNGLKEVNHIDGNKENVDISNLEWISRSGNVLHAYRTGLAYQKLDDNDAIEILKSKGVSDYELSLKFNCSVSTIRGIKNGHHKKHIDRSVF